MAQQGLKLDLDKLCCPICLDLMKDPATLPCGHSYCQSCMKTYWDREDQKETNSCPQCRQSFRPKPVLVRNTVLADLVEEKRKVEPQAAPGDPNSVQSGGVECDLCSEKRKLRATKSCLTCLVSYCQEHVQPHFSVAALKKHKLVEPTMQLEDSVCPLHSEVMKIYCRTDQRCICYLCLMDEHEGHQTLSAAAEMSNKQKELTASRAEVQQGIQRTELEARKLQQVMEDIKQSADEAVRESDRICADVKQRIQSRQKSEVSKARELGERLEEEIGELRRRSAALEELSRTDDHIQFLQKFSSVSRPGEAAKSNSVSVQSLSFSLDAGGTLSQLRDKLKDVVSQEWTEVPEPGAGRDALAPQPEPETREEFLEYAIGVSLDLNTKNRSLQIEDYLKVSYYRNNTASVGHPDQFSLWPQILCRQSLTGRCYWEVKVGTRGCGRFEVFIAVSYKDISRDGPESAFGNNNKSWALQLGNQGYEFRHNCIRTPVSGPFSTIIRVYLDHSAGTLSFYSFSDDTMTLLHRFEGTFTRPLCPGLGLYEDSYAEFIEFFPPDDYDE